MWSDAKHLEQIAHLAACREALDLGPNLVLPGRRGVAQPSGSLEQTHRQEKLTLRRGCGRQALGNRLRRQRFEIDMRGEIGFARGGKYPVIGVTAHGLQRVADA